MVLKKKVVTLLAAAALAALSAEAAAKASFEKVPAEAKKALGGEVGKPITKGVVFLNGHYLDFENSYQVARVGTAIYLRQKKGGKKIDVQVTPPLKPWNAFLETQDPSVVSPVEAEEPEPAAEAPKQEAPKPKAEPKPAAKKPAAKPKSEEDADDFFDDDEEDAAAAAKAEPSAKAETESKVAEADEVAEEPTKPEAGEAKPAAKPKQALKLTGAFAKNAGVERLLKPISETRKRIDAGIRNGRVYFFSARHGMYNLDPRLGVELIKVLPAQMKDAKNGADLYRRLRSKNILYVKEETCDELMANRVDYLKLDQLRLRQKADTETNRLIYGN